MSGSLPRLGQSKGASCIQGQSAWPSPLFSELGLGYRAVGMKYETGSGSDLFIYDMTIFGPQIGAVFHF